jgi:hypothetical protein
MALNTRINSLINPTGFGIIRKKIVKTGILEEFL